MTLASNLLTLTILRPPQATSGFTTRLTLNDQAMSPFRPIAENDLALLRHVIDGCRQLLKSPGTPTMAEDLLTTTGIELFHLWLAPDWDAVQQRLEPGKPILLVIASDLPELLLFPWEAMRLPDGVMVGTQPAWGIQRRMHTTPVKNHCRAISPGPLRILFMASAPTDFHAQPAQQEIDAFQKILPDPTDPRAPRIETHTLASGMFTDLARAIYQFQPHVVHLCGPVLIRENAGFFAFEDNDALADVRTTREISADLLEHSGIGLVVISGHESNKAPPIAATGVLCQGLLARQSISMALAWPESLTALESVPFLQTFYTALAQRQAIHVALTQARTRLLTSNPTPGRPGWTLAALYAQGERPFLFNAAFTLS